MPTIDAKNAPPVPFGKVRVQAVHNGYFGDMEIEVDRDTGVGEVFDIPIYPLSPKTGLPQCFSDSRVKVMSGRSGWMRPFGASEEKKLADLEAVFKKTGAVAPPMLTEAEAKASKLEAENAELKKRLAEAEGKKGVEESEEVKTASAVNESAAEAPAAPEKPKRKGAKA